MIRVTTLYAGTAGVTARYYTRYLTQATCEEPGIWVGAQAERFGIDGATVTTSPPLTVSVPFPLRPAMYVFA